MPESVYHRRRSQTSFANLTAHHHGAQDRPIRECPFQNNKPQKNAHRE
jgi:hypothetical protein